MQDALSDLDAGKRLLDWIARYHTEIESHPVLSRVKPREVFDALPDAAPETPEDWDAIERDLDSIITPGLTHWQHPSFFGFFPANASTPAIMGELLSAGLGIQGMLWATSPACTELEMKMADWMARAIALPESFTFAPESPGGGVIQGTASEATLIAMHAARKRTLARAGLLTTPRRERPELIVYASTQAHSSVIKAAMLTGLADGPDDLANIRLIETDDDLAMDPGALERAIREDLASGHLPCFVCATVGTTSSLAFDPLDEIAAKCERAGFTGWLHADAAHAGSACVCEEHRWMLTGIESFDSLCFNPHKWLLTNFDCDLFYTRDRAALIDALSITPEYLRNPASDAGEVVDYRDWQVPLGRRFRALKLWFVMRRFGLEGLREHVRDGVAMSERFESLVRADERFEVVAKRRLNLICFRLRPREGESAEQSDTRNKELLDAINATGEAFLTHTVFRVGERSDAFVLRMSIGGSMTAMEHVDAAWRLIRSLASS